MPSRCVKHPQRGSSPGHAKGVAPEDATPFERMSGGVLLSHAVTRAVPSALRGLASGFGMEPGVSLSLWPPKLYGVIDRFPTVTREPHSGRESTQSR
jgi:hypothetical protein